MASDASPMPHVTVSDVVLRRLIEAEVLARWPLLLARLDELVRPGEQGEEASQA